MLRIQLFEKCDHIEQPTRKYTEEPLHPVHAEGEEKRWDGGAAEGCKDEGGEMGGMQEQVDAKPVTECISLTENNGEPKNITTKMQLVHSYKYVYITKSMSKYD